MAELAPLSFSRPKYRADIDGMRALAILAVLIFHAYPSSLPGGFVGVDVFFVISGYLISGIIFRGLSLGSFSFFDFYARRVRRIFPAVTVVLLASFALGIFFVTPFVMKDMVKEAPYAAFFIENIRLFLQHGEYWDVGTELKPYMHFWSLGVEEQYYIFYPLICYFLWKGSAKVFLLSLIGMLLISFGWCLYDSFNEPIRAFYMLHARFWELLIGGVLAYVELKWPDYKDHTFSSSITRKDMDNALSTVGLLLILIAIATFHEGDAFPGWRALLPTVGSVLIIMAGSEAYLNKKFFSNKVAVFIGLISYPLYLWHWPLISIARNNLGGSLPTGLLMVVIVCCSFVLAYLTYTLIERPMRSMKATWKLVVALVLVLLISTIGVKQLSRKDDMLERWMFANLPQESIEFRREYYNEEPQDPVCTSKFGEKNAICRAFGQKPQALIFGDSHAILSWNFIRTFEDHVPVYLVGSHSGVIFTDITMHDEDAIDKQQIMNNVWEVIEQSPEIRTIVLIGYWSSYVNHNMTSKINSNWTPEQIFQNHWRVVLEKLSDLNKNVIIVLDNPPVPTKLMNCLNYKIQRVNLSEVSDQMCRFSLSELPVAEHWTRNELLAEVKRWPNVRVVDFRTPLCPNGSCSVFKNDLQLYWDDDHLSKFGYEIVWPSLESVIREMDTGAKN